MSLFLIGLSDIRNYCGFMLMQEYVMQKHNVKMTAALFFMDGLISQLGVTIYFWIF